MLPARPRLDAQTRRLLATPAFRRLFAGRVVSGAGDALYFVAATWLAYELTGSTLYAGAAGFLARAPGVAKVLVGPLVDRRPLRRVLVGAELAQGVVVLFVPAAAALGVLGVGPVLLTMLLLAVANLPAGPAGNAALPRVAPDSTLVRANTALSTASEAARAAARAAAGALVAAIGGVALYLLDAATFLLAAALFRTLPRLDPTPDAGAGADGRGDADGNESGLEDGDADAGDGEYLARLEAGVALVAASPLAHLVIGAALAAGLSGVTTAVLPAFAAGVGGADVYGLLLGAVAAGTLAGSVGASLVEDRPLGRIAPLGFGSAGALWIGAVAAPTVPLTLALVAAAWVPIGAYNVLVLALVQAGVPDGALGRVSAIASSATSLAAPLGLLAGGALGTALPARVVLLGTGVGFAATAAYWALTPAVRRLPAPARVESGGLVAGA